MDNSQTSRDERAQRFYSNSDLDSLHKQLGKQRGEEIKAAIAAGIIDDPNARKTLEEAVDIVGTCTEYCPYYEKVERHLRGEVKRAEMSQKPGSDPEPDYSRMVKAFTRPNDINSIKVPSDIRPPPILQKTLDYLFHDVLSEPSSWISKQEFIFDRTRAIRQDFTIQGSKDPIAVESHERIARFHILSLHESRLSSQPDEPWEAELRSAYSLKLDIEQLNKTFTTLLHYYNDFRVEGKTFPNEAEFHAYRLLLQVRDSDVATRTQHIPYEVLSSPWIQAALELRSLAQNRGGRQATSFAFSRLLKQMRKSETTFLMACLMEIHLPFIRKEALRSLASSYVAKSASLEKITRLLGFEDSQQTMAFVEACGLNMELGNASDRSWKAPHVVINKMEVRNFTDVMPVASKYQSEFLISKRNGASWSDIIDGKTPSPRMSPSSTAPLATSFGTQRPAAPAFSFGRPSGPTTVMPAFGTTAKPSPFGAGSGFGASSSAAVAGPSKPTSVFGTSSAFGAPSVPATSAFGAPTAPGSFGAPASKPQTSFFGTGIFGQKPTAPTFPTPEIKATPKLSATAVEFVPGANIRSFLSTAPPKPAPPPIVAPTPPPAIQLPKSTPVPKVPSPLKTDLPPIRRPSIATPLSRKASVSSVPHSPVAPSPRTLSRIEDQRNTVIATNLLNTLLRGAAQMEVAMAFADEWARRRTVRQVVRKWKERALILREVRMEEEARLAKEQQEKQERWQRLMKSFNGEPSPGKWKGKEKEIVLRPQPITAVEMQQVVSDAARAREKMWEPAVFLDMLLRRAMTASGRMKKDPIPDDWGVYLAGKRGPTLRWLKVKLGMEPGQEVDDGKDEVVMVPLGDSARQDGNRYPGLIVFELSPALAGQDASQKDAAWPAELSRLAKILSRLSTDPPYRTGLLVVYWGEGGVDIHAQKDDVLQRVQALLDASFAKLSVQAEPVVFRDPEQYHRVFQYAIQNVALDLIGVAYKTHRFETIMERFILEWTKSYVSGLALCSKYNEASQAKWLALAQLFAVLVDGLNVLRENICNILGVIDEDTLPVFTTRGVVDEETFNAQVLQYLSIAPLSEDLAMVALRNDLLRILARHQELPLEKVLDKLAWHVEARLRSVGHDIVGSEWEDTAALFDNKLKTDIAVVKTFVEHQAHQRKRSRVPSGGSTSPTSKKPRQSGTNGSIPVPVVLQVMPPQPPAPSTLYLKSELADLERLLAESEAMLV